MKTLTIVGIVLVAVGILFAAGAATADFTGMNVTQKDKDCQDFGWVQVGGSVLGAVLALSGATVVLLAAQRARKEALLREEAEEIFAQDQEEKRIDDYKREKARREREWAQREAQAEDTTVKESTDAVRPQTDGSVQDNVAADASVEGQDALGKDLDLDTAGKLECPDCGCSLEAGARSCLVCGAQFGETAEGG